MGFIFFAHAVASMLLLPLLRASDTNNIDNERCEIIAYNEGLDYRRCDCPDGYVLCGWKEIQLRTAGAIGLDFARDLCDPKRYDEGTGVYIDFNLAVVCDNYGNTTHPKVHFSSVPPSHPVGSSICELFNFFLCKRSDDDMVDCEFGEWTSWGPCKRGEQTRIKAIIHSGQHGGEICKYGGVRARDDRILVEKKQC
eukprot:GHVO01029472.1.p1 GENE.GHVO01029472.1~~GHVO01029472.1.p1  ORF type:complete len:196 (-),score=35.98 GHVO01029472.1:436-1023(-)